MELNSRLEFAKNQYPKNLKNYSNQLLGFARFHHYFHSNRPLNLNSIKKFFKNLLNHKLNYHDHIHS